VSASASNADPATWWMGVHFGLSGEGTVVYRLRLPGFDKGLATFMNEEWWSHPCFPSKPDEVFTQSRFLAGARRTAPMVATIPSRRRFREPSAGRERRSRGPFFQPRRRAAPRRPDIPSWWPSGPTLRVVDRAPARPWWRSAARPAPSSRRSFMSPWIPGVVHLDPFYRDVTRKASGNSFVLPSERHPRKTSFRRRLEEMKDTHDGRLRGPQEVPGGLSPSSRGQEGSAS
jgi:hypothetical protein